jgi:hypothetical protein
VSGLSFILVVGIIGSVIWVGVDASKRDWGNGSGTGTWVLGCILLWIVVFPVYLYKRGKAPLKDVLARSGGLSLAASPGVEGGVDPLYRECPHCKEPMRRDAWVCPHCQQPSTPWRLHKGRWWYRDSDEEPWVWLDERTGEWQKHVAAPAPSEA